MKNSKNNDNALATDQARALRRKLLAWYRKHARDLPWRTHGSERPDPYHTLVSEAMLQQTQVATVIPYFHRFLTAFPTITALANADEQQVLTLWQGLGYYRRARNLHAAAKAVVEYFDGAVPHTVESLLSLPGVGRYTAGAIASIAHGTQAAVVDGNVERVFARLLLIEKPINAPATKKQVWTIADSLVPKSSPGDFNQAVMELGALICTPKAPKCLHCPLKTMCRARLEADPEALPVKLAKKKPKDVTHIVFAVKRKGHFLFEQRPADGLWSNMWQLPTWEEPPGDVLDAIQDNEGSCGITSTILSDWFADRFGLEIDTPRTAAEYSHQTTHRTISFVVLQATAESGRLKANTGVWRKTDQLDDLPMSNPQRKAVRLLNT